MDKELKARLQHAVIGEGNTTTSSIPKKGEIVFNDTLDNLKVGDGSTQYSQLNNLIKTIAAAAGSDIGDVGTPSVTTSTSGDTITFTFHQLKGERGDRGSKWFTGSGVPSTVVDSEIGDYYLNSSDGGVWEKTGETAWTYRTNIMGASGADGATWHSGTAVTSITSNVPSGVVVGDYYLNTNTYNVYKCISTTDSTKWSLECNIKGSQGNPGSNGNSVFISYSANADGSYNHSTFTTGDKYIGIYVGQFAPSSYTGYTWCKFIGDDGTSVTIGNGTIIIKPPLSGQSFGSFTTNQVTDQTITIPMFGGGYNYGLVDCTDNPSQQGTKYLKNDGSWGVPSYTQDTYFYGATTPLTIEGVSYTGVEEASGGNIHVIPNTSPNISGHTATELNYGILNLVAGNNITFRKLLDVNSLEDQNPAISGIVIDATGGGSYTLPVANATTLGGLIVHQNTSRVDLYTDDSDHASVPIYYAEHTGSDSGPARHYVNIYDILQALRDDEILRGEFKKVLEL